MDERVKRLLAQGREHYLAGEHDRAEACLAPLAEERLPFADVYEMLGMIQYERGQMKQAEEMFKKALALNPGYTEAALNLAVTYNEQGRYDEAAQVYKRMMAARKTGPSAVADLDPFVRGKIANMHFGVGEAYEEAGLPEPASVEYEKALDLCPTFVDIRMRLGSVYRSAGDLVSAIREFERVKREKPELASARLQLGLCYYAAKRFDEAGREWNGVLAREPDNKFARMYLGLIAREALGPGRPRF